MLPNFSSSRNTWSAWKRALPILKAKGACGSGNWSQQLLASRPHRVGEVAAKVSICCSMKTPAIEGSLTTFTQSPRDAMAAWRIWYHANLNIPESAVRHQSASAVTP